MKYQLALQWGYESGITYDDMISIEDALIERLSIDSEVDGHDMGGNQINIFIFTNDVEKTMRESLAVLSSMPNIAPPRAGARAIGSESYRAIFPKELSEFKVT